MKKKKEIDSLLLKKIKIGNRFPILQHEQLIKCLDTWINLKVKFLLGLGLTVMTPQEQ
jgi:hypothetical protein